MTRRSCHVLVVGGGLAGIQAAEVAAQFVSDVLVVDRGAIGEAPASLRGAAMLAAYLAQDAGGVSDWKSTRVSLNVRGQGGAATAVDAASIRRGFHAYLDDIAEHGARLGDPQLADFTAAGVYNRIGWLESYGLHVVRDAGRIYRGFPAPGHRLGRVLLLEEPPREVLAKVRQSAAVFGTRFAEALHVIRLLVEGGRVAGALALEARTGELVVIETGVIVLAAGGADRLYRADPRGTAGSAYQLALDAGVPLANMEFVAFAPEAAADELPPGLLMVLLGLGARFLDKDGGAIPAGLTSVARLTRDVAGAKGGRRIALHVPPAVAATLADLPPFRPYRPLLERGIPVRVGGGGLLGGLTHRAFTTGVPGLFVAGAAATGCHGADLLAGVDTSFTLYSAENAASAAATYWSRHEPPRLPEPAIAAEERRLAELRGRPCQIDASGLAEIEEAVRGIMWTEVGLQRTGAGLTDGLKRIRDVQLRLEELGARGADLVALAEARALVLTAGLVGEAALRREESLGQHVRVDAPAGGEARGRDWITVARRDGTLTWKRVPVPAGGSDTP